jgi:hypothetical protein
MIERERRVTNFIFRLLVQLFPIDKKMDTVDSQILDGGPPQRLLDSPIPFRRHRRQSVWPATQTFSGQSVRGIRIISRRQRVRLPRIFASAFLTADFVPYGTHDDYHYLKIGRPGYERPLLESRAAR